MARGFCGLGAARALARIEAGRETFPGKDAGLGMINCIYPAADGALWLGSDAGRLYRYKDGRFVLLPARGQLNRALQILGGPAGKIWVSADSGVFYFDASQMNAYADGKTTAEGVSLRRVEDFPRAQCTGLAQPAGCLDAAGRLWFPTFAGVVQIESSQIPAVPAPPVFMEEARAAGKALAPGSRFTLPSAASAVEFKFTALNLHSPGQSVFQCKLDGLDEHWETLGSQHTVRYNNLPPGEYRFRVRASTGNGAWSETEAALPFRLEPHFYQTGACYFLCWLILAGAAYVSYRCAHRWRQRALVQRDREVFQFDRRMDEEPANRSCGTQASRARPAGKPAAHHAPGTPRGGRPARRRRRP